MSMWAVAPILLATATSFATGDDSGAAVAAMIGRVLGPGLPARFDLELTQNTFDDGVGSFELLVPDTHAHSQNVVVVIRGTSGVELAAGVGHYLRHVANVSLSWPGTGGNTVSKAVASGILPILQEQQEGTFKRNTKYSYSWNVCECLPHVLYAGCLDLHVLACW
jgi:hypothetical protein